MRLARSSTFSMYQEGASSRLRWGGPVPIDRVDVPPGRLVEVQPGHRLLEVLGTHTVDEGVGRLPPAWIERCP